MPRKIIILSVDHNPTYAWFVPLCTLMWRDVADFDVSCIFVGQGNPWILDRVREVGTQVYECEPPSCCPASASSQLIRLFSYTLPGISPEDYLLSVDADAWPLARAFDPSGAACDLIYPESADHAETPYFPIGYIGAKAQSWREFMGVDASSPELAMEGLFLTDPTLLGGHSGWNYDETLVTRKIKAWRPMTDIHVVKRSGDPPVDRIDRAAWPAIPVADGKIDAHLLRPAWTEEDWPRLRPLLEQRLSRDNLAWADNYRAEWLKRGCK
jgi:hypothetical protein